MRSITIKSILRVFNIIELSGIMVTLLMAFIFQLHMHQLPCPLCLLQRIGFIAISFGFLLNLRFGLRASHYSLVVLSALFTSFAALTQIALHIVPGTGSYGDPFLGLHLYTWSFIISMLVIIATTFMLGVDRQYINAKANVCKLPILGHLVYGLMLFLISANLISLCFQCGLSECPDNPVDYKVLKNISFKLN